MNCPHCGAEYKDGWKFCVNCAKPLPTSESKIDVAAKSPTLPKEKKQKNAIGFILVVVLIITVTMMLISGATKSTTPSQSSASTTTSTSTPAPTTNKPPKVENWQYSEKDDTIHNAKIKFARTTSINTLSFKFPYNGIQHGHLILRKNYDGSKDAMVVIEKGQFMTSVLGGKALIRFDDNSPEEFQLLAPQDNSTTTAFIKYADYFIKNVAKSKKVYIQTAFYQEGSPTLEFNVEGFSEL